VVAPESAARSGEASLISLHGTPCSLEMRPCPTDKVCVNNGPVARGHVDAARRLVACATCSLFGSFPCIPAIEMTACETYLAMTRMHSTEAANSAAELGSQVRLQLRHPCKKGRYLGHQGRSAETSVRQIWGLKANRNLT